MISSNLITPKQLALAIGVSESSLKRWADDGLLEVSRTAGGPRRIPVSSAIQFVRQRQLELVRPDAIGLPTKLTPGSETRLIGNPTRHLTDLLIDGKQEEAELFITSRYLGGQDISELADGLIRESLAEIGEFWQHRGDGIVIEHRATDTCVRALLRMRSMFEIPEPASICTGAAVPGDHYMLPSLVASLVAAENGLIPRNLGPDTPFDSMKIAAEKDQPVLFWVTVSVISDMSHISSGIMDLKSHLSKQNCVVAVGGREANLLKLDFDDDLILCQNMRDLRRLILAMHAESD